MFRALALAALVPGAALAQDGRAWIYNRYVEPVPTDTVLDLGYGVPQSDDVQAALLCTIDGARTFAQALVAADVEGLATGAEAWLEVSAPGYSARLAGRVVRHEEYIHGVEVAIAMDDAFWTALMGGGVMTYGVPGRARQTLPLDGATDPAHAFLGDCLSIRDLTPDAPVPIK